MQRIIATVLFSGALIAVAPAVVLAEAIPKKGATSYVTHFVFHPLSSIDVPGAGKATSLEAMGRHLGNGVSFSFGVSPTMTAPLPFRIGILAVRGL